MPRPPLLAKLFPTVRVRLVAILLVAAIPIFVMAASIAVQSFHVVLERSGHQTALLLAAARARHGVETEQLARLLAGLARIGVGRASPAECTDLARVAFDVSPPHLISLAVVDADSVVRCEVVRSDGAAGAVPRAVPTDGKDPGDAHPAWWSPLANPARASATTVFRFAGGAHPNGLPVLAASLAIPDRDGGGFVAARVAVDWLAAGDVGASVPGTATWLATPDAPLAPLGPARVEGAIPEAGRLGDVLRREGTNHIELSAAGLAYAYDATPLEGGAHLVVGVPAASDLVRADSLLGRRIFALGGLLILGLVAMALGVHAAVVRPIKHLSRAVGVWRNGGPFDRNPTEGAPSEVVELAHTFGEATAALRAREGQLLEAGTRQELLIQEIHHRVKNNLQIIASLLNLQASRIRLPEARAEFQAARDRIRALATLHRHLYAHGELHQIDMREFLTELCTQLLQAMGETPDGGRIHLDIEAPALQLSSDQAVPFALIVTEAVSNSAKYAFPGGRGGHVTVRVDFVEAGGADGPRRVRLVIQDDGVGIPAGRVETESGVRDGLGIQLIRGFARQLGATLEVSHEHGTRYVLEMVLRQDRAPDPATEPLAEAARPVAA